MAAATVAMEVDMADTVLQLVRDLLLPLLFRLLVLPAQVQEQLALIMLPSMLSTMADRILTLLMVGTLTMLPTISTTLLSKLPLEEPHQAPLVLQVLPPSRVLSQAPLPIALLRHRRLHHLKLHRHRLQVHLHHHHQEQVAITL